MFIFQTAAFLILILCIARKFRIQLVEAIPVGSSLLILGLYLLAFFRLLSFSDYLAMGAVAAAGVYLARLPDKKRKDLLGFAGKEMASPAMLTALVMTVVMTVCVSGKPVSWWDDYNFWATDVKSLFYLDGFAGKYANVAPEFGDYPPGTQLMKWWFLHFSPGEFREGLMFAGYYFLNLSFLFPLLKVLNGGFGALRKLPQMLLAAVVLWSFPAVAEAFWCDGCCADLTMALVYGAFLVSVADREGRSRFFYYGRQALFLMVLVLCKNTGFMWAAFGLLFDYGYHFFFLRSASAGGSHKGNTDQRESDRKPEGCLKPLLAVTLLPVLTEASWLGFCLWNRRVAKLTGTAIQMATGGMNIPAYQEEMVKAFIEAFLVWPLHRGKTPGIDLSPLALFVLLLVFVVALWRLHVLEGKKAAYAGGFLAVTGVVFYSINLMSHLTIFAVETQYLEPFGMVSSIERYGAPFAIGGMYLLAFFAMQGAFARRGAICCAVFVLLTTDLGAAYRALWGYRSGTEEILAEREEIIDEEAEDFLAVVHGGEGDNALGRTSGRFSGRFSDKSSERGSGGITGRVLYLRDISDVSWVRNTYVGFAASPVSVMYGNVDVHAADPGTVAGSLRDAHAGFLYVDQLSGEGEEIFRPFMRGEDFSYGRLYRVEETEEGIVLYGAE